MRQSRVNPSFHPQLSLPEGQTLEHVGDMLALLAGPCQLSITSHIASYGKLGVGPWVRLHLWKTRVQVRAGGCFQREHCWRRYTVLSDSMSLHVPPPQPLCCLPCLCNCILAHLCMLLSVLALRWVVANLYITLIGWLLCSKGMTWAGEIDC